MKNFLFLTALFLFLSQSALASERHSFFVGAGFNEKLNNYKIHMSGPDPVDGLFHNEGAFLDLGYLWERWGFRLRGSATFGKIHQTDGRSTGTARLVSYGFDWLINLFKTPNKWDPYFSLGSGFTHISNININFAGGSGPVVANGSALVIEVLHAGAGTRYFFNDHFSANAEFSFQPFIGFAPPANSYSVGEFYNFTLGGAWHF
ncbi:MAG: outer membrane beta-barrel protein [Deltaproteobacteria bacterium]|nr:outer membrane beta-barrel protein [Deltaproteobacteria bacterium]